MADKLIFKQGAYSNLHNVDITNGTVYFTTDTNEIYFDQGNTRHRLQDVITGETIEAIQTKYPSEQDKADLTGRLLYATNSNVLFTWNGTTWVQINAQHTVDDLLGMIGTFKQEAATSGTAVKVISTIGTGNKALSSSFGVAPASSNVHITRTTDATLGHTVNVAVDQYVEKTTTTVAAGESANSATITTASKSYKIGSDGALTEDTTTNKKSESIIAVNGSGNLVSLTADSDGIDINANLSGSFGVTAAGGIQLELKGADANTPIVTSTVKPVIKLSSAAAVNSSGYTFTGNAASQTLEVTLPVYTKAEVDSAIQTKLEAVNSMTFMGTVSLTADATVKTNGALPTSSVKIGDTYKVVEAGTYKLNKAGTLVQSANIGDLFIATSSDGTEGSQADSLQTIIDPDKVVWTYVPSGDETQYTLHYHEPSAGVGLITLGVNATDMAYGTIAADNSWVKIAKDTSNAVGGIHASRIDHITKDIVEDDDSTIVYGQEANAKFITGLTIEGNHVTGIQYATLMKSVFAPTTVSTTATSITGGASYTLTEVYGDGKQNGDTATHTLKFVSNSLAIDADAGSIGVELEWGSF